jgi:hypothetical protein
MIINPSRLPLLVPCENCAGSGFDHCCDGEQAQPTCTVTTNTTERLHRAPAR